MTLQKQVTALLALATYVSAQGFSGFSGGQGGNPYGNGGNGNGGSSDSSSGSGSSSSFANGGFNYSQYVPSKAITAHAVLAAFAFVILFPSGGILIRLGRFRGLWIAHAAIQVLAYLVFIAAFGIGMSMATSAPSQVGVWQHAHPIIGTALFVILFFQPILGLAHHVMFKKHNRRLIWSYGHLWLGRIIITIGIINGGLGLRWAKQTGFAAPSNGQIIAYAVLAVIMWCVYVASAIYGEVKRHRAQKNEAPPEYMEERGGGSDSGIDTAPGAPHGVGEYYKNRRSGQRYA